MAKKAKAAKKKPAAKKEEYKPRIVAAVMSAAGRGEQGIKNQIAKDIEAGMKQAVEDALAHGVSIDDSYTLREVQLKARQDVLDAHRKALASS